MSLPPARIGTPDAPAQIGVSLEVVVGQRRLEPPEPHRVELARDAQRGVAVVALLGVVHHRHPRPAVGGVHLAEHLQVAVGLAPGVELDRAEASLEQVADERHVRVGVGQERRRRIGRKPRPGAAQQLVERETGALRSDVPERDVERRLRARQEREREVLKAVPDGLSLQRIGAQDPRCEVAQGLENREVEPPGRVRRRRPHAVEPLVVEGADDGQRPVLLVEVGCPA